MPGYDLSVGRSKVSVFKETDILSLHLVRKQSINKQALKMISEYGQCHGAFSK